MKNCIDHYFELQPIGGDETVVICRKCGLVSDAGVRRWPLEEGERVMWAVLGESGGIYAFASSAWKAEHIQKDYWNIGNRKPIKYLIKFKRI